MNAKYSHVLSPIRIGNTLFRNRIFASPVSLPDYSNVVGMTDRQKMFYANRARGGAASVATGDGVVDYETGFTHPYKLQLDNKEIFPALGDMTRLVRQYGAVPTIELSHGGKYANVSNLIGDMKSGKKAYGPNHEFTAAGEEVFEMPVEMIRNIADSYGRAAAMAKNAGFGMILIHGGHGWLLNQFMSPATNHRNDEFGGSFENRMRFALMVIDSVRAAVGKGFPIEFRMSGAEFTENGYDIDYGIKIAKAIDGKVDLIHVSAGVHDCESTFIITHPSMFHEHGCNVFLAEKIKKEVNTPVATIGGLNNPDMLEEIIASGKADVVEMGRQLMADPNLPRKMAESQEDEIMHCMRCFTCMEQLKNRRTMRCAINPQIGREDTPPVIKTDNPKLVVVVGGGPAGMEAALAAHEKGHKVQIYEAAGELGGKLVCEKYVPFKKDMYGVAETLINRVKNAGIEIHLNTRFDEEIAKKIKPDVIVAAMGAEPVIVKIPGYDRENVFTCMALTEKNPNVGQNVAIIGGGLVGCETAVHFALEGKKVSIVEMLPDIARDAMWPHRLALMEQIEKLGIDIYTGTGAKEITDEGLVATKDGNDVLLKADSVMMAAGLRSNSAVADTFRDYADEVYIVGDCVQPGQLFAAMSYSYYTGREI